MEALASWEREPQDEALKGSMFRSLFAVVLSPDDERKDAAQKSKVEGDRDMAKAQREGQLRREQSIMLQAKLLALRNEILKEEFAEHATNN